MFRWSHGVFRTVRVYLISVGRPPLSPLRTGRDQGPEGSRQTLSDGYTANTKDSVTEEVGFPETSEVE